MKSKNKRRVSQIKSVKPIKKLPDLDFWEKLSKIAGTIVTIAVQAYNFFKH
jgi:hypothetical protein